MVIVAFPPGEKYAVNYTTLDQYDYGQILRIQGLKLPKTVEVHFSTQETGGISITRVGVTKDGVTDVLIPDSVLENGDTTQNYSIFAFVYVTDDTSGKTEYRAKLEVKARSKPEIPGGGDNPDVFHEAVLEVRKSAEKAEEAQRQAEGWAHGREDLPERAEDNAMYYAGKASEDAKKTAQDRAEVERLTESNTQMQGEVAKDLEDVKKLSSQAQTSATNAALSEQKSKEAATRAETAQTGAETAEDNAKLAAQKTGQDKTAVEQAKKLVQQMGQEVLDNKNAVDKTVQDFGITAQQALADVNNAGQTQTERVQSAGTTAVENIKTAQNTATQAVETAKTEAIKAVQTEGTTQIGNVTAEGEKQVQAVQTAAQEIIADREKIQKNTTDIADLRQKKADAIVESVSGTLLNVKDSSGAFFEDFSMSGKTTQDGTPTPDAPVEIVNAGQDGTIEIKVTGKNLLPNTRIPDKTENGITMKYKADGVYHFSGTSTNRFDSYTLNLSDISFLPGKYRILTGKNVKSQIVVTQKNTGQDIWYGYEFTINKGDKLKYWYCTVASGKIVDEDIYVYMERDTGNTLTVKDFEPPREPQTITLSSERPLTKWDRLEKREGVWGIVRQSAQEELTQYNFNTYILPSGSYPTGVYCYATKKSNAVLENQSSFCTHFKNSNYAYLATNAKIGLHSDHDKVRYKYFISDKPTVEEFKAWLTQQKEAGTPVELVYKTAEETWEPLPEEMQLALNALHTNYPTTVVSNFENAEMQLTYIADTKNYYLNREQTLQKQILDIQNALISQKISGGGIKVTNSAKLPIVKLSVFGKSEQVQTTGAQLLNYYKLAELSPQYYAIEQGELKVKGSNNAAWTSVPEYGTLAAGTYTISGNNVEIRDASKNTVIATCTGDTFSKFTLNEDTAIKMKVGYGLDKYPTIVKAMLNKGDSKKPYEPYTGGKPSPSIEYPQEITSCGDKGTIEIKVTGKNLIPFPYPTISGNKGTKNGITWEVLTDGGIRLQGTASTAFYLDLDNNLKIGNTLIAPGKTDGKIAVNKDVTYNGDIAKAYISVVKGMTVNRVYYPQIEYGTISTSYEPYREPQELTLPTQNGLPGLKVDVNGNYTDENGQQWITDEIDLARGKYVQRIEKRILDGSEALADNIGSSTSYFLKVNDARSNTGMCNYGKRIPITGQKQEELTFSIDDNGIYLYTTKNLDEFKNELKQKYDSGKPVEVLYALKTPIEYDLPPEIIAAFKKLHTNYPTTIITNNADAGMELTYTVDTQSYVDSKIAEINMQVVNTQKQLLQERSK